LVGEGNGPPNVLELKMLPGNERKEKVRNEHDRKSKSGSGGKRRCGGCFLGGKKRARKREK